jgi:hypothetical protein
VQQASHKSDGRSVKLGQMNMDDICLAPKLPGSQQHGRHDNPFADAQQDRRANYLHAMQDFLAG